MAEPIDRSRLESFLRDRLRQEGRSADEIEAALRELRAGRSGRSVGDVRPRWEYKSTMSVFGLPLVHIVLGRDPATGRVGKAVGVIAIARVAIGVLPIGQLAIGVFPIGQLAVGLLMALGQGAFAGFYAVGQVAVASDFALGQLALAASAVGQVALGRFVLAQVGWGRHVWSTKVKDPEAVEHFKEMVEGFLDMVF